MHCYKNGELERFTQSVGKQYGYGKGLDHLSAMQKLELENRFLKEQIELLKKHEKLERKCLDK